MDMYTSYYRSIFTANRTARRATTFRRAPGREITSMYPPGFTPATEHDWPARRQYEALAMRDKCLAIASGEPDEGEPTKLWH
ncbi:MAG: hypothetical protein AUJ49_04880 [Desulfovibrionaceae bacterium CG1_02_65_16]|nr:MAG: hypothetical protein AUJ49_04880 [Desulfovibrionaceae bacterium CG1_02_65_16]